MLPPAIPPTATGAFVTPDGVRLFTQRWATGGPPRGAVALVHGYAEHSGRYGHVAHALRRRLGLATHAYDQRGHGRSGGPRGYVPRFDLLLGDLGRFLATLPPTRPRILMGHSMGGLVAALYAVERAHGEASRPPGSAEDRPFDALVLSSPAVVIDGNAPAFVRQLAPVLGRLAPRLPAVPPIRDAISRDASVLADAEADPLNYRGATLARTGAEMLAASRRLQAQLHALRGPLYVTHGTADRLTDPDGSRRLAQAATGDVTLRLYDGLYHETLNEPERARVLDDLVDWLAGRVVS
jgi:alpha-beta hydrolase superfamily lysophospholipase